jgi:D-alanyl-lipoteichoic acid acyltransferase DltB (MBOAT superfamily)
LFKKVILADNIGIYSDQIFAGAARGIEPTFGEAWVGALSYTFQIYFDFSGYTDMAIGLGRMFGIRLPLNFCSPYKAGNIIEFWRRWHITLSRFLRDYLYIPLGGNRKGRGRSYINLLIVMLLGGLWHGANWTFVAWGGLHGIFLVVNHGFRAFKKAIGLDIRKHNSFSGLFGRVMTFVSVVVAWVLFRSEDFNTAARMFKGMAGLNETNLPSWGEAIKAVVTGDISAMSSMYHKMFSNYLLIEGDYLIPWLGILLVIVWVFPNTQQYMRAYRPGIALEPNRAQKPYPKIIRWRPSYLSTIVLGGGLVICVLNLSRLNAFIYFQF